MWRRMLVVPPAIGRRREELYGRYAAIRDRMNEVDPDEAAARKLTVGRLAARAAGRRGRQARLPLDDRGPVVPACGRRAALVSDRERPAHHQHRLRAAVFPWGYAACAGRRPCPAKARRSAEARDGGDADRAWRERRRGACGKRGVRGGPGGRGRAACDGRADRFAAGAAGGAGGCAVGLEDGHRDQDDRALQDVPSGARKA